MKRLNFFCLLSSATTAFAHGGVFSYFIDGIEYLGHPWKLNDIRPNATTYSQAFPDPTNLSVQRRWFYDPVYDLNSTNLTCNWDASSNAHSLHAQATAGSIITAHWDKMPDGSWPSYWEHSAGPLIAYMAACPGETCSGFDGSGAVWFKIAQIGLTPDAKSLRGPWEQWDMVGTQPDPSTGERSPGMQVTIPKTLRPGPYLIRHEIIMLASTPAQFYPNCAQLMVKGSGDSFPSTEYLAALPGAYKADDPGISIADWCIECGGDDPKPWLDTTDYKFPGPPVWTG